MKEQTIFVFHIRIVCMLCMFFEAYRQIHIHFRLMQVQEKQGMTFSHFQIIFQQAGICSNPL